MKEIEFRGQRTDTKEWVYGNLLKLTHEEKPIYYIIPSITNGSWSKEKLMLKFISPCFEVIPETVGQYTGLKDKNGTAIYEGDIVRCLRSGDGEDYTVDVEIRDIRDLSRCLSGSSLLSRTVIGNIHDNLILL